MITRVQRNTPATLSVTFTVDGTPTDPDVNAATFTAYKADGTVHTATTAATRVGVGNFEFDLPSQTALQILEVRWTGNFSTQPTTISATVEIVGGFIFTVEELKASEKVFQDKPLIYTYDKLANARQSTEEEFERICKRAFVPRFGRWAGLGDGTNELWLPNVDVHNLTKLTIDGVDYLHWQAEGIVRIDKDNTKLIYLREGNTFPEDTDVVVEYEHGYKITPYQISDKGKKRARMYALGQSARRDERVTVVSDRDGGRYNLATPGMDMGFGRYVRSSMGVWHIGVPDIDVVLEDFIAEPEGVF